MLGDEARAIQQAALHSRLGIPVIFGIDAIHGHGINRNATIFPSQLAMACAWNPELVREVGRVTAREVATDGLHWTFSPVLCLGRDTRWGRVDETFGEDPYLAGELGAAIIRGYQGESLAGDESILACAKHYIGYGEAVGARDACDTQITYRKMREVFLPPFAKAIQAGCASVMTAYGSIDGTPFTASRKTMIIPVLVNPWNLFLLRNFFSAIPAELHESARIDGANDVRILWQIILPVSLPALATVALFYGVSYWNQWFNAMLYIEDASKFPLQYLIMKMLRNIELLKQMSSQAGFAVDMSALPTVTTKMATAIVTIGPIVIAYPFAQKYFTSGLIVGSVKG